MEEWKNTEIWKVKAKAMNTNTGESPGYQEPVLIVKKLT